MTEFENAILIHFSKFTDERGSLVVWENKDLPFTPARTFTISNVPTGQTRANHSISCDLLLVALSGTVDVVLEHKHKKRLTSNKEGMWIKKNTFIVLENFSENAILLAFAEEIYSQTIYKNR